MLTWEQRVVEREHAELASHCLGPHHVSLLYGTLKVGTERRAF
jgi:hypothetical protein